jgi:hypothetical protein
MPKRVPKDEKPFRPVEHALVSRVMSTPAGAQESESNDDAAVVAPLAPPAPKPRHTAENVLQLPPKPRTETPQPHPEPPESLPEPLHSRRNPQERFYLNPDEKSELNDLVNQLTRALGTGVKSSNVHRALHLLCRNATQEILRRADQYRGQLFRPSNENHVATAEFEYRLAKIISAGLRDAPSLREHPRE